MRVQRVRRQEGMETAMSQLGAGAGRDMALSSARKLLDVDDVRPAISCGQRRL